MVDELYVVKKEVRDIKARNIVYPRLFLIKELKVAGFEVGDIATIKVYPNKIEILKQCKQEG